MVKLKTMDRPLEDGLDELVLSGLDEGLLADQDGNDMPVNGAKACSNIMFGEDGSFQGRPGWLRRFQVVVGPDIKIDGCKEFLDSQRSARRVVWAGGNMYDCTAMDTSGIVTFENVYESGNPVCSSDMYGELVYSDGVTIATGPGGAKSGCRYYDPVEPIEGVLERDDFPGAIEIPACKAMCNYNSSLVLANLLFPDGETNPESVLWSNVGNIRAFLGNNIRPVASGEGGQIISLCPFTLSTSSVSPSSALFVGKDQSACFSLRGPVSDLEEIRIRSSTGVLDAGTVSFIPYSDDGGVVVYLGVDRHFHITNGVTDNSIIKDRIRKEVADYINDRLSINPYQRFYAGRNFMHNQYICNLGAGRWYAFDWDRKRWTRYDGWPDGACLETLNSARLHQLYILELDTVTNTPDLTVQMCQMNASRNDNSEDISPFWQSCFLRGSVDQNGRNAGSLNKSRLWYYCTVDYETDFGAIKLEFNTNQGTGKTQTHVIPAFSSDSTAKYGEAKYGESKYAGAAQLTPRTECFRIPYKNTKGQRGILRGRDLQVKVSLDSSTPEAVFKINSISLAFTERGMAYVQK